MINYENPQKSIHHFLKNQEIGENIWILEGPFFILSVWSD
jgi:hypothetical protein